MSRPTDWYVLDLDDDPTPGDPVEVGALARRVRLVADDAERAEREVRGLAGDGAVLAWLGLAGDVFRGAIDDFPSQLAKLADSYHQCGAALSSFSSALDGAQAQADRALEQGRTARAEINDLSASLSSARSSASSASTAVSRLDNAGGAEPPDPDQVRSATRNAQTANDRVTALSSSLGDAQGRLDVAKRLARDAEDLRNTAGDRAKDRLYDASDAGIEPNSWWENFKSAAAQVWSVTITIAKIAVAVLGIVVLIIGGPLAWVVVGLSVLILADALMKVANGEGGWLDVGIAALGLIPGVKGLTSLGALKTAFAQGRTLGVLTHLGSAGRGVLVNGARGAQSIWQGRRAIPVLVRQAPFSAAARVADMAAELRHGVPGALRGFQAGLGQGGGVFGRLRTGASGLGSGFTDARSAFQTAALAGGDPAYAARAWQRASGGRYPGIDVWDNTILPQGHQVEALYPGVDGFVTPAGTMDGLGRDAARISEGAQVGPARVNAERGIEHPYRSGGVTLEMGTDVPAATGTARANPQYGAGGSEQHFIPNLGDRVHSGEIIARGTDGRELGTVIDEGGRVLVKDADGQLIALDGLDVRPGSGVWDPQNFGASRDQVLQGSRDVYDAVRIPVGIGTRTDRLVSP